MITRVWSSDQITDPSIKEYWHFSFMSLSITDSMSSTARLILDTLDKMSTPIQVTTYNNTMLMNEIYSLRYILRLTKSWFDEQDAKKMPALVQPRAEKRKLIEEELNCSLKVCIKASPHDLLKKCKMLIYSRPRGVVSGLAQELSPLRAHLSGLTSLLCGKLNARRRQHKCTSLLWSAICDKFV